MKTKAVQLRKSYEARFVFRLCVLALTVVMYFLHPDSFDVLKGFNSLHEFSWLHLLWIAWVVDMIMQLVPVRGYLPLGSLKQFQGFYRPVRRLLDRNEAIPFLRKGAIDSLKVFGIWALLVGGIGVLWTARVLREKELLLISVVFYVCDLICVLFWCPFRAWILKNRCCTTCPIFNWDHLMMFSPLLFIPGMFSLSLFAVAAIVFLVWEVCFVFHPERFCEDTNVALQCHNCTDRLCGGRNCRTGNQDGRTLQTPQVDLQTEVADMALDGSPR